MWHHASGYEDLTERIIGCAMRVHSVLGAGLLESIYTACLVYELSDAEVPFDINRRVPVVYKGRSVGPSLVADLVVREVVLVEVKAVEAIAPIHVAQVITYLKLTGCPVGLLINFNVPSLRTGIRRLYNPEIRKRESSKDPHHQAVEDATPADESAKR